MRTALGVPEGESGGGAIAGQGLRFAGEFCIYITLRELKERVGGIFLDERGDDGEGAFILLIVTVEVEGQIEARRGGREESFGHVLFQLADAFLLVATGNAHEEAQDFGDGAEGIGIIIVEAESKVGVGKIWVELNGAEKMLASVDSRAGGGAILAAKTVKAGGHGVAHARVKLHFGGFVVFKLREGQR